MLHKLTNRPASSGKSIDRTCPHCGWTGLLHRCSKRCPNCTKLLNELPEYTTNNKPSTPVPQTIPPAAAGQGIPVKTVPCTLDQIARQIGDHAAAGWLLLQHIKLYANDILLVFVRK